MIFVRDTTEAIISTGQTRTTFKVREENEDKDKSGYNPVSGDQKQYDMAQTQIPPSRLPGEETKRSASFL